MAKRGKLEIIRDILEAIKENHGQIKITPLIRKSNMSSMRFQEYFSELLQKGLINESYTKSSKKVSITEKGKRFLMKYKTIIDFIDEFEL